MGRADHTLTVASMVSQRAGRTVAQLAVRADHEKISITGNPGGRPCSTNSAGEMIRAGAPLVVRKKRKKRKNQHRPEGWPGLTEPGSKSAGDGPDATSGRAWLASLPAELAAQRHVMAGLVDFCESNPVVTSLSVGCSLGRGAGDALSDIDAALGIEAERGQAGAEQVLAMEAEVTALLPTLGPLVDVLHHRTGRADQFARRIFAQFADGTQLDLAVVAEAEVRRGDAAPDFVSLYWRASQAEANDAPSASAVTGEQISEWAFFGWCALIDADKYLRRGSLWEAHNRLHEARHKIWALWAAATGAIYPWHGLSQVLDHDPENLPPGIESTVARLDRADLRRAAQASATVLTQVSAAAAQRYPAELPSAMARYVTHVLSQSPDGHTTTPADLPPWPTAPVAHGPVVLREFSASDIPMTREMSTDPYVPLIGTLPANASEQEARAYIDRQRGRLAEGMGFSFAIAEADTNRAVGGIGLWLHGLRQGRATVGYSIAPSARGKGLAAAALIAVTEFAWTIPALHRIEAYIEPWNVGSVKTAEQAGYQREGLLRSHQEIGGQRRDMLLYATVRAA
jgi:RimJ/RimL family protein N-acetyltransferase